MQQRDDLVTEKQSIKHLSPSYVLSFHSQIFYGICGVSEIIQLILRQSSL